jgi:hypothetical protein
MATWRERLTTGLYPVADAAYRPRGRRIYMQDTLDPLVFDLVEWVGTVRLYAEVIDAWKTSCPRLPVWEEATSRGLLFCARDPGGTEWVHVSEEGRKLLEARHPVNRP